MGEEVIIGELQEVDDDDVQIGDNMIETIAVDSQTSVNTEADLYMDSRKVFSDQAFFYKKASLKPFEMPVRKKSVNGEKEDIEEKLVVRSDPLEWSVWQEIAPGETKEKIRARSASLRTSVSSRETTTGERKGGRLGSSRSQSKSDLAQFATDSLSGSPLNTSRENIRNGSNSTRQNSETESRINSGNLKGSKEGVNSLRSSPSNKTLKVRGKNHVSAHQSFEVPSSPRTISDKSYAPSQSIHY